MRPRTLICLPDETTLAATRWVERLAGWQCELRCDAVPPGLAALGIDPNAGVLLAPAAGSLWRSQIDAFVATSRCDALIVQIGGPGSAAEIVGTCVQWHGGGVRWHQASPFWLSDTDGLWLFANNIEGFHLIASALRLGVAPWNSAIDGSAGVQRANQFLRSEFAQ